MHCSALTSPTPIFTSFDKPEMQMAQLAADFSLTMPLLLLLLLLLARWAQSQVESGESILTIKFNWYENMDDKLSDGNLCDTNFQGKKESSCDPMFRFEIMREGGSAKTLFSYQQEDHFTDKQRIDFQNWIGKQKNPDEKDIKMDEEGDIYLKIRVEDYDPDGDNDLMDIFVHLLAKTKKSTDVELVSKTTTHRFSFTYRYGCKSSYFGPLCVKRCVAHNDDTRGHYNCSSEGDKICLPGWMNVDEDCRVPDWCRWC